ncbi:DUF2059 domain-containing protein [Chryseobacterium oryctis]|uniref:DUF2059 domain-containing protein n=1 Tax=Chryseobacterium oryctis TaxID=2952618 RepID=A0ABT3HSG5_9FLAO|nr:DUF2059 domain-containing protein [Chryseobacterium oryctis]MCW3162726.1 DUF2059 domain-containing protein [Chryseobacterium oryctis]
MKKLIITCSFFIGVISFAQSSKTSKVQELIALTETDKMIATGFQQFMDYYNNKYKDLPTGFWDEFKKEATSEKIIAMYIPLYDKYYTESDIDELIKFYKTPVGKKMISSMPSLLQESMEVVNNYTKDFNKKVNDKINKHYKVQSPPQPVQ